MYIFLFLESRIFRTFADIVFSSFQQKGMPFPHEFFTGSNS